MPPKERFSSVCIVGLGGIGSHIAEPLARLLSPRPDPPPLILVDGDRYDEGNAERQRVLPNEVGQSKAAVHARRFTSAFPALGVRAIEEFLSERNAREIILDRSLIICCPDNHATRLLVSQRCQRLRNAAAIFAGNDLTDGTVQVFVRRNGRNLLPPPEAYHQEIREPQDRNPAELSCAQLAALPGGEQVIATNFMAASLALNAAWGLLKGHTPVYTEVFFDVTQNRATARERKVQL